MQAGLLLARLGAPPVHKDLVSRPRLIEKLDRSVLLHHRLTLLSAPAGYGKTCLLSEWIKRQEGSGARHDIQTAWLSLDQEDNDPVRFWSYVIATLQTAAPGLGSAVQSKLLTSPVSAAGQPVHAAFPQAPGTEWLQPLLIDLLTELQSLSSNLVLVLDDYQVIQNRSVHASLAFLLDNLPDHLHLILATRKDPPLPLARLRVNGEMTELRAADLKFNEDETKRFFRQSAGIELQAGELQTLTERIEGWTAGLKLVAIALQSIDPSESGAKPAGQPSPGRRRKFASFIQAFAGDDSLVVDYLLEEVFVQQPAEIQDFLLCTSILTQMSAPLCAALLQNERIEVEAGSPALTRYTPQAILESLEAANLFIVPLDNRRQWYRYHHLFADLLRYRLRLQYPDRITDLHRRASRWYEHQQMISEAVQHACAAQEFDEAARLIQSTAFEHLLNGRISELLGWLELFPREELEKCTSLLLCRAWACILSGRYREGETLLQSIEANLLKENSHPGTIPEAYELYANTLVMRACIAFSRGDLETAAGLCRESFAYLPENELVLRSAVNALLGIIHQTHREMEIARRYLIQACDLGQRGNNFFVTLTALGLLARFEVAQGQLRRAAETCSRTIQLSTAWGNGTPLPAAGLAYVELGDIQYEWNDLEGAGESFRHGIELGRLTPAPYIMLRGWLGLARVHQALGNFDQVEEALQQFDRLAQQTGQLPTSFILRTPSDSLRARIALQAGNMITARRHLAASSALVDFPDFAGRPQEEAQLTQASLQAVEGNTAGALAILATLLERSQAEGRQDSVIQILALQATVFHVEGRLQAALSSLEQALQLAEPEGYLRTFLDAGPGMARLLYEAVSCGLFQAYASRLLSAFGPDVHHPHVTSRAADAPADAAGHSARYRGLVSLSSRELEVLSLVAEGLSNPEIAGRLSISIHTARAHTSNIYRKLDVRNRVEALSKAMLLGILQPS